MAKRGGYGPGFMQRFGFYDDEVRAKLDSADGRVWVHAVSVGEVFVALKYIEEIRAISDCSFILTVTTSTGHSIAAKSMHKDDVLLYFPVDFTPVVRRVIRVLKPKAIVLTECELWPNLIRLSSAAGIPVSMINGRISDSSFKGYRMLSAFSSRALRMMKVMQVQTESDAERLRQLGADSNAIKVVGSSKYDVVNLDQEAEGKSWAMLESCGIKQDDMIIVAGSTWPGEEKILLDICSELRKKVSNLKLILVPRHAERRSEVEAEVKGSGLSFVKRSDMDADYKRDVDVLIVDTTGELKDLYSCATVIFVGKSLTVHGGQNFIEPAFYAKPVITGPNLENFPVVAKDFLSDDAIIQIGSAEELEFELSRLLGDASIRAEYGAKARAVVDKRRGSVKRNVEELVRSIGLA